MIDVFDEIERRSNGGENGPRKVLNTDFQTQSLSAFGQHRISIGIASDSPVIDRWTWDDIGPTSTDIRRVIQGSACMVNQWIHTLLSSLSNVLLLGASCEMDRQVMSSSSAFSADLAFLDFCIEGQISTVLNPSSDRSSRFSASLSLSNTQVQQDSFILPIEIHGCRIEYVTNLLF